MIDRQGIERGLLDAVHHEPATEPDRGNPPASCETSADRESAASSSGLAHPALAEGDADPNLRRRYARLRRRVGRIVPSNYDISDRCNLRCDGCLFFDGDDYLAHRDDRGKADWAAFFAAERQRGVNFAYIAGAEPALQLDRIRVIAENIDNGVIFTNGTRHIPRDIPYRLHISIWGAPVRNALLRGGDNVAKAIRLYAGDERALFVYTVGKANIDDIGLAAETLHDNGLPLTFSYFSPTEAMAAGRSWKSAGGEEPAGGDDLAMDAADLDRARAAIDRAIALYPDTIRYSLAYDDWVRGESLYTLDPVTGYAGDCGSRRTAQHHHYGVDLQRSAGKCCSPNIDCKTCRAYAQGYATYLNRFAASRIDPGQFAQWLGVWESWADLFLPIERVGDGRPQ